MLIEAIKMFIHISLDLRRNMPEVEWVEGGMYRSWYDEESGRDQRWNEGRRGLGMEWGRVGWVNEEWKGCSDRDGEW